MQDMALTLSNANSFSKFFYHWKEKEISNKSHIRIDCCRTLILLPRYFGKVEF